MPDDASQDEGLIGSLRRLGRSLPQALATRLEILSLDLHEERLSLTKLALVAMTILFCVQVGLMFALLFFVLAMGPEHRLAAIGIAAAVMLAGAGFLAVWLRSWLKRRGPVFGASAAEFRKDAERIRSAR